MNWFRVREELTSLKEELKYYKKACSNLRDEAANYDKRIELRDEKFEQFKASTDRMIEERDAKIEKLQSELDILRKHFKLDEAPSQTTRIAVRIDDRVHQLEIENAELKAKLYYADTIIDAFKPQLSAAMRYPDIYDLRTYCKVNTMMR